VIFAGDPRQGRLFVRLGAILGFLGVALGAFGAHALRDSFDARQLDLWEKAVRYLFVHALALIAVGGLAPRWRAGALPAAGWLFALGAPLFSGSLLALALGAPRVVGAITPFGGVSWLAGWAFFALAAGGTRSIELEAERRSPPDETS
jgi:uncharacterized membrane protein YgdD (TMEM256/DUF423 family)